MSIINQIVQGGGTTPTGTLQITTNGTHDVTSYATADVQVPTTAPAMYVEKMVSNNKLVSGPMYINLTGVTMLDENVLRSACYNYRGAITLPDFSDIIQISSSALDNAFFNCTGLTGTNVDFSSLTTVSGYCCRNTFQNCTGITGNVDLSGITRIVGGYYSIFNSMFYNCTGLNGSVNISSLTDLQEASECCKYMFYNTNITSVDLSKLQKVSCGSCFENAFANCKNLSVVKLDSFQNLFSIQGSNHMTSMFSGCTALQTNPFISLTAIQADCGSIFSNSGMVDGTFYKLVYTNKAFSYTYYNCSGLTKLDFPALARINNSSTFSNGFIIGCTNANFTKITLPMLTILPNQTSGGFGNNCFAIGNGHTVEVHFRKDMQTTISALSGYASKWAASDIVFDLVGTITVNGNQYRREGVCNKPGYIAWQKVGSTITVNNEQYNFDTANIDACYASNVFYPKIIYGALYVWKTSDGTKSIYLSSLEPTVGDVAYTNNQATTELEITAVDNEIIYTVDSTEPVIGDTAYSDTGTTVIGTISAIA